MRVYLFLLCLVFSSLSYGNDLISGYEWRSSPTSLIKSLSQTHKSQPEQLTQNESSLSSEHSLLNEHSNKATESSLKSSKANLDCKQNSNSC